MWVNKRKSRDNFERMWNKFQVEPETKSLSIFFIGYLIHYLPLIFVILLWEGTKYRRLFKVHTWNSNFNSV